MGTALLSGHQSIRLKDDMTMFSSYGLVKWDMDYRVLLALQ